MKKSGFLLAAIILSTLVMASAVLAAGFRLPEQSNSTMGMASAFAGQADDASAVWYNPAGITQLSGTRIMSGVIAVYPILTHETLLGTTEVSERTTHIPFHLYATHRMDDQFAFGLGINNPFGLQTDWDPQTSITRNVATFSKLVATEVNPNVAYKLSDTLSVAAGIAFVRVRATLENRLPPPAIGDPNFRLSGDGEGWGANAALHFKASEQVSLGLSYRSRVKVSIDGTAQIGDGAVSNSAETDITLPDLIQAGVSYKATDTLTLNADLDYTMWSTYDRVVATSDTVRVLTGGATDIFVDEKDWKDVWCLRIGGQYRLSDQWKVKAGYLYDKNPVNEEYFETRVPDSDRQGVSVGAGYSAGPFTADAAYMYLRFNDRTIDDSLVDGASQVLNGTYKSQAHLFGITLGYTF